MFVTQWLFSKCDNAHSTLKKKNFCTSNVMEKKKIHPHYFINKVNDTSLYKGWGEALQILGTMTFDKVFLLLNT